MWRAHIAGLWLALASSLAAAEWVPLLPLERISARDAAALGPDRTELIRRQDAFLALVAKHNGKCSKVKVGSAEESECESQNKDLDQSLDRLASDSRALNKKIEKAAREQLNWCKMHKPLNPHESVVRHKDQDQARASSYAARRKEYCELCACTDQDPPLPQAASAGFKRSDWEESGKAFLQGKGDCGEELTGCGSDKTCHCCPEGFPYYSSCDGRCYKAAVFNSGRLPCDSVIQCAP